MKVFDIETGPVHVAPVANGPHVNIVVDEQGSPNGHFAAARVLIPPGGGMPEHDHGPSEALVMVQKGWLLLSNGDQQATLEPGRLALLAVGERVRVENPYPEPAVLLAIFAPPDFIRTLAAWPTEAAT